MTDQKQKEFEMIITSENIISTDPEFTMNNLRLGDAYGPIDIVFINHDDEKIERQREKGEHQVSIQKIPRLTCQIYEKQLEALSPQEKKNFPICRYSLSSEIIRGIFPSKEAFNEYDNDFRSVTYTCADRNLMVLYCWNIFSTLIFVQECLKRFGQAGDKFILTYKRVKSNEEYIENELNEPENDRLYYLNAFSQTLLESKNVIFRGAPGTGKSYMAKEIAADIISEGHVNDYDSLTDEQKKQVEFVQFHPSYDYSDFVEGLRPRINDNGTMNFQLEDGIFTKFVKKAQKNIENADKSIDTLEKETSAKDILDEYLSRIDLGVDQLKIASGNRFYITAFDEAYIYIAIPDNTTINELKLNKVELLLMLESGTDFNKRKELTDFFGKTHGTQAYSYDLAIFKEIKAQKITSPQTKIEQEGEKPFIFIIDEINRAEISKVLGELFFSIDPGYRGTAGEVSTQYASLHENPEKKFSIPKNVYIIGTMNDIDRSVDSFDFAMRRRFRFIEIKAEDRLEMLNSLGEELKEEAINRMEALNNEISTVDDLNENYFIGASYFLKLKALTFDQLWEDYLLPLLQDYVRGMYDEEGILKRFARAYGYSSITGDVYENVEG